MPAMRKPLIKVVPGQIWADKYPGSKGRTVRIVEVGATHATVEVATEAHSSWSNGNTIGRQTRVSYGPRGLSGYTLETDVETPNVPEATEALPENPTVRQFVEHWRDQAVAHKAEDKTLWSMIEYFANNVLRLLDQEEDGDLHDLGSAADPAERAAWARENVRVTLRNAQAAVDAAAKAFDVAERDRERAEKRES